MTKLELELGESQIRIGGHRAQSADLLLEWLEIDPRAL